MKKIYKYRTGYLNEIIACFLSGTNICLNVIFLHELFSSATSKKVLVGAKNLKSINSILYIVNLRGNKTILTCSCSLHGHLQSVSDLLVLCHAVKVW